MKIYDSQEMDVISEHPDEPITLLPDPAPPENDETCHCGETLMKIKKFAKRKIFELLFTDKGKKALTAAAIGAFSVGAMAYGVIAIGKMAVGNAHFKELSVGKMKIDHLKVKYLEVEEQL
ncbi:MAG: hypothetical protein ACLFQV_10215 [Vulcanimicrobiota bacterium]